MLQVSSGSAFEYDIVDVKNVNSALILETAHAVWAELKKPGSRSQIDAKAAGIDLDTMPATLEEALSIEQSGASIDVATLSVLVVALAPAANRVAGDIWKHVILPRISRKWGEGALKEKDALARAAAKKTSPVAKKTLTSGAVKAATAKKTGDGLK